MLYIQVFSPRPMDGPSLPCPKWTTRRHITQNTAQQCLPQRLLVNLPNPGLPRLENSCRCLTRCAMIYSFFCFFLHRSPAASHFTVFRSGAAWGMANFLEVTWKGVMTESWADLPWNITVTHEPFVTGITQRQQATAWRILGKNMGKRPEPWDWACTCTFETGREARHK